MTSEKIPSSLVDMTHFRSSLEFSKIYYDALIYNLKCQHFLLSFKWRDILVMDSEYNKAYRLLYMDPTHHRFWAKVLILNINTEVLNALNWPTPLSTILLNTTPKSQSPVFWYPLWLLLKVSFSKMVCPVENY